MFLGIYQKYSIENIHEIRNVSSRKPNSSVYVRVEKCRGDSAAARVSHSKYLPCLIVSSRGGAARRTYRVKSRCPNIFSLVFSHYSGSALLQFNSASKAFLECRCTVEAEWSRRVYSQGYGTNDWLSV
ncbi:hypothetical protein EVAR_77819_1 [Eumeta japonica]|uniref:Uncharacterized protein n=1 Tax=Eumeta variegata TaxID=151549 RepID=A0A4C1TC72_EUMVA|nr:hypothetical protein EVAR_77819_1 [Eumeta japonica]